MSTATILNEKTGVAEKKERAVLGGGEDVSSIEYPQCWGHRGASAAYPENTLASFEAAIRDGAEGIESDVHITSDDVIVMFHDSQLDRTTNGKGLIKFQPYYGGLDQIRTKQAPHQSIPTFKDAMELLMKEGNRHVVFNIDVKVDNDPERLFSLIHKIVSAHQNYDTLLAPRLILGLWHPKFIQPARRILPYCKLAHIGMSTSFAIRFFWNDCDAFSMAFPVLVGNEGREFRNRAKKEGKEICVWTVNKRSEMIQATKWGVKAILTDKTDDLLKLRSEMRKNWSKVSRETSWVLSWTSIYYYSFMTTWAAMWELWTISRSGGPIFVPNGPQSRKVR